MRGGSASYPSAGRADPEKLAPHIHALQKVVGDVYAGRFDGVVRWGADARPLWEEVYPDLTSDAPGMAGKILGRGSLQALRLAVIYALADGSTRFVVFTSRRHSRSGCIAPVVCATCSAGAPAARQPT